MIIIKILLIINKKNATHEPRCVLVNYVPVRIPQGVSLKTLLIFSGQQFITQYVAFILTASLSMQHTLSS